MFCLRFTLAPFPTAWAWEPFLCSGIVMKTYSVELIAVQVVKYGKDLQVQAGSEAEARAKASAYLEDDDFLVDDLDEEGFEEFFCNTDVDLGRVTEVA